MKRTDDRQDHHHYPDAAAQEFLGRLDGGDLGAQAAFLVLLAAAAGTGIVAADFGRCPDLRLINLIQEYRRRLSVHPRPPRRFFRPALLALLDGRRRVKHPRIIAAFPARFVLPRSTPAVYHPLKNALPIPFVFSPDLRATTRYWVTREIEQRAADTQAQVPVLLLRRMQFPPPRRVPDQAL